VRDATARRGATEAALPSVWGAEMRDGSGRISAEIPEWREKSPLGDEHAINVIRRQGLYPCGRRAAPRRTDILRREERTQRNGGIAAAAAAAAPPSLG